MRFVQGLAFALATATAAPALAIPTIIPIDDFNLNHASISDTSATAAACTSPQFGGAGSSLSGVDFVAVPNPTGPNEFARQYSINLCSSVGIPQADAVVSNGVFDISMGAGEQGVAVIRYSQMDELFGDVQNALGPIRLVLDIFRADLNPIEIGFILNGTDLGTFQTVPNSGSTISILVPTAALFDNDLDIIILGAPGYDLALDNVYLSVEFQEQVAEPAAVALFGLGLAALALRTRRR